MAEREFDGQYPAQRRIRTPVFGGEKGREPAPSSPPLFKAFSSPGGPTPLCLSPRISRGLGGPNPLWARSDLLGDTGSDDGWARFSPRSPPQSPPHSGQIPLSYYGSARQSRAVKRRLLPIPTSCRDSWPLNLKSWSLSKTGTLRLEVIGLQVLAALLTFKRPAAFQKEIEEGDHCRLHRASHRLGPCSSLEVLPRRPQDWTSVPLRPPSIPSLRPALSAAELDSSQENRLPCLTRLSPQDLVFSVCRRTGSGPADTVSPRLGETFSHPT
jgi:hypothetical protein